ncbi:MAG: sulfatase-like hydrolase/transferase, partial [Thermoanaerobaculia bacterium]
MLLFFLLFSLLSSKDILLITLDTTRADYITREYSPFLYSFSQKSFNFKNCRTPVPLTLPAHTSILTGLYPKNHKVRNNSSYKLKNEVLTLQEILKKNGYFNAAFVSSFVLNSSFNLNKGFDIYDDEMLENYDRKDFEMQERGARDTSKRALEFLENFKGEKLFLWVHFFDPHYPYLSHPESPQNFSTYAQEIYFMDISVKALVEKFLQKRGGIVVIAGDHGESLGEHGEETHGIFLYEAVLKVPLIIKFPEKGGMVFEEPVLLIDIFPTILDYLKIDAPKTIDGISLLKNLGKRDFYFETFLPSQSFGWATPFGIFDGKYKFIYLPKMELYNLEKDKGEKVNLLGREKEKGKEFLKKLKNNYTIEYE